jgi:O-antigen/teichoic acid export membrane protein
MLALENFVPGSLTRSLMHGGIAAMQEWMSRFRIVGGVVMGGYCLLVALFAEPLMTVLFGSEYGGTQWVVVLVSISYFAWFLGRPPAFGLRALTRPRWLFYSFAAASLFTLLISVPLVGLMGITGAGIGMILTQLIVLSISTVGYRRESRTYSPGSDGDAV